MRNNEKEVSNEIRQLAAIAICIVAIPGVCAVVGFIAAVLTKAPAVIQP